MIVHSFKNMFGEHVIEYSFKPGEPHGYPEPPGSGPPGETCRTCEHRMKLRAGNKKFYKCDKNRHRWGNSTASDIVLKTPACRLWEQSLSKTPRIPLR